MKIEFSKKELLFDIMNKSHGEVSVITDAEARYKAEAGTEKTDEIERDLITSTSILYASIGRFLCGNLTPYADNGAGLPETLVYEFTFSERRLDGKAQPLADAIHAFLVDSTLGLFYNSVSASDLAVKRSGMAQADLQLVERLVYTKKQPYMTRN